MEIIPWFKRKSFPVKLGIIFLLVHLLAFFFVLLIGDSWKFVLSSGAFEGKSYAPMWILFYVFPSLPFAYLFFSSATFLGEILTIPMVLLSFLVLIISPGFTFFYGFTLGYFYLRIKKRFSK